MAGEPSEIAEQVTPVLRALARPLLRSLPVRTIRELSRVAAGIGTPNGSLLTRTFVTRVIRVRDLSATLWKNQSLAPSHQKN
jgi:hypothetical protein